MLDSIFRASSSSLNGERAYLSRQLSAAIQLTPRVKEEGNRHFKGHILDISVF